jgi:hypothetical protein
MAANELWKTETLFFPSGEKDSSEIGSKQILSS